MERIESKFAYIFENDRKSLVQLSDVKLRTDDGCSFNVHRVTLARSSEYFSAMFCFTDAEKSEFEIPGISGECLSDILCYVYTGNVQVTERNARDLIIAADYLLMKDLRMEITRNIKAHLTEVNCLRILQAAHQIGDEDIFRECFRFITTRFEGVMRCQKNDLADLPLDILISILSNRSLYVYNESTVWQAIVEWTQKDITLRMSYIPQLLLTLAMEDVGEKLVTKILQHEIVSQNPLFRRIRSRRRDLQSDRNIKRKKISDLDVFLSFLRSYSTGCMEPNSHRIPLTLHVLCFRTRVLDNHILYITYDENPEFLRKITEETWGLDALIVVRHNIYTLKWRQIREFNLRTMNWKTLKQYAFFHVCFFVAASNRYVYVFTQYETLDQGTYRVEVYDAVNNRWFYGVFLRNSFDAKGVAIEGKIFVVGNTHRLRGTLMQMFDPITQQWSHLTPPTVYRPSFRLVVYHQKIYLIGSYWVDYLGLQLSNIEVFDPAKNVWEKLPDIPYTFWMPNAIVFDDELIFFDMSFLSERNRKIARWNDVKKFWEKLEETYIFKDLHLLKSSCIIDDVETIRIITKQNRDPKTKLEKSFFNWNTLSRNII